MSLSNANHLVIVPDAALGMDVYNLTETSANYVPDGYYGSRLRNGTVMNSIRSLISSIFGSSLIPFWAMLTNSVTSNRTSEINVHDCLVESMNYPMLHGNNDYLVESLSIDFINNADLIHAVPQLSLFRLAPEFQKIQDKTENETGYWLRDILSPTVGLRRLNYENGVNFSSYGYIRPYFCIG